MYIYVHHIQSINFSANFMLYCILNPSFRRSIKSMLFRATSSTENHLHTGLVSGHVFERSRPASGYSLQVSAHACLCIHILMTCVKYYIILCNDLI